MAKFTEENMLMPMSKYSTIFLWDPWFGIEVVVDFLITNHQATEDSFGDLIGTLKSIRYNRYLLLLNKQLNK